MTAHDLHARAREIAERAELIAALRELHAAYVAREVKLATNEPPG